MQWTTKDTLGSRTEVAVSGASDVTVGCNMDPVNATMHALEATMGQVPWSFDGNAGSPTNGACPAGPSIADGMAFCVTIRTPAQPFLPAPPPTFRRK